MFDTEKTSKNSTLLTTPNHTQYLSDLIEPLEAHMPVVLIVDMIAPLVLLVGDPELGDESGEEGALSLEDLLGAVPVHHRLQHGAEEAAVARGLVLRAGRERVGDVAEQLTARGGTMSAYVRKAAKES